MPSDSLRAGQRIFICTRTDDAFLAMVAAEDYYGVGQGHYYGVVTGVYDRDRYRVMSDAGEELLLYRKDFELVDDRAIDAPSRVFLASAIVVGLIAAIGYFGV